MSSPISTQCPQCEAILKLKSSSAIGKKISCPKCGTPFVVEAQHDTPLDDYGADYEDDYGAERPPALPRKAGSARRSSKKKQESVWKRNRVMIACGIGLFLLVDVVFAVMFFGAFTGEEESEIAPPKETVVAENDTKPEPKNNEQKTKPVVEQKQKQNQDQSRQEAYVSYLSYLPEDSELVFMFRPSGFLYSPWWQKLLESNPDINNHLAKMKELVGFGPGNIASISIGVAELESSTKLLTPGMMTGPSTIPSQPAGPGDIPTFRSSLVIRTRKAFDQDKILGVIKEMGKELQERKHAGKSYYSNDDPKTGTNAVFFPDDKTMVFADEQSMKKIIISGGKTSSQPHLKSFYDDVHQHLVLALLPRDRSFFQLDSDQTTESKLESEKSWIQDISGKIDAVSVGLTFEKEKIAIRFRGRSIGGTKMTNAISEAFKSAVTEGISELAEAKKSFPLPVLQDVIGTLEDSLKKAEHVVNGNNAQIHGSIPISKIETLAKAPGALMTLVIVKSLQSTEHLTLQPKSGDLPMGNVGNPSTGGDLKPAKPLKATDLKAFNKSWQVDLDIKNQPAGEALKKLVDEMGLTLDGQGVPGSLGTKKITLKLKGKSRLEAVEAICRQLGIHANYQQSIGFSRSGKPASQEVLELRRGIKPNVSTVAGPFLVTVGELKENVPHATGSVPLQVVATNLPASVLKQLNDSRKGPLKVTGIEGPKGESLRDEGQGGMISPASDESVNFLYSRAFPLKNLVRAVSEIKEINGALSFDVPTKIDSLTMNNLTQGASQKNGAVTFTIKKVSSRGQYSSIQIEVTGAGKDFKSENFVIELKDSSGQPVRVIEKSYFGFGKKMTLNLQLEGKPTKADVKVISESASMNYDFALSKIPLKLYRRMPEKIEPAKYAGHDAPVSLEFVKIAKENNFQKIEFKAVNHANKDVESLEMTLIFLDAAGKKLKESSSQYQRQPEFDGRGGFVHKPTVRKNAEDQIEVPAFFMPEMTKTVKAELKGVRFIDAEVWEIKD